MSDPIYTFVKGQGWVIGPTRKTVIYGDHHHVSMSTKCLNCGYEMGAHTADWYGSKMILCRDTEKPFEYDPG